MVTEAIDVFLFTKKYCGEYLFQNSGFLIMTVLKGVVREGHALTEAGYRHELITNLLNYFRVLTDRAVYCIGSYSLVLWKKKSEQSRFERFNYEPPRSSNLVFRIYIPVAAY